MNEYISQEEIDRRLGLTPRSPTLQRLRDAKLTEERGARVAKGQTSDQITDRDAEQVEIEAAKCPCCRKLVGWKYQEVKKIPVYEFDRKVGKVSGFPIDFSFLFQTEVVLFKECPKCEYVEEVGRR